MNRKTAIVIAIFVLVIAGILLLQKGYSRLAGCQTDSDCKLIYSSCDCEAVPLSDQRTYFPDDDGSQCKANSCTLNNLRATCYEGGCIRSDEFVGLD